MQLSLGAPATSQTSPWVALTPPFTGNTSHLAANLSHSSQSSIQLLSSSSTIVLAGSTAEAPLATHEVSVLYDPSADTEFRYKSISGPGHKFSFSSVGLKTHRNVFKKIKSIDWSLALADD